MRETSLEAHRAVRDNITEIKQAVLDWASDKTEGFTDVELVQGVPQYGPSTLRTRRSELVDIGRVQFTGRFKTHGTSRRRHMVWAVAA